MIYKPRESRSEVRHALLNRKIQGELYEQPLERSRQERNQINWHIKFTQLIILTILLIVLLLVLRNVCPAF